MAKLVAVLLAGALIGAAATYGLVNRDAAGPAPAFAPEPQIVRDIVDIPKVSAPEAEKLREERYAGLTTIEDIYALPSEFGRAEALYMLAGRSDSASVQALLFDANRIADEQDRAGAVNILFFRLSELDPQSSLAMARMPEFAGDKRYESRVWATWGRANLDEALAAAKSQSSHRHRNAAAQSLFSAFGYMGNDITDYIEQELDIKPDRTTRSRFLYRMADRNPAEAVAWINAMEPGVIQEEFVSWLAFYLGRQDATMAEQYADLFENPQYAQAYRSIVDRNRASANPRDTLDRLIAEGSIGRNRSEYYSAMRTLAAQDLEAALEYYSRLGGDNEYMSLGYTIASEYAKRSPEEALAWARENDHGEWGRLTMQVLSQIATTDPEFAMREALATRNSQQRRNLLQNIISQVVEHSPAKATRMLDGIENPADRRQAAVGIINSWAQKDPEAAVNWALAQDARTSQELMGHLGSMLPRMDLDAAIRVLPRLDGAQAHQMRVSVAQRLAQMRSAADAQAFIRQFEGEEGYMQLQGAVIQGVARQDAYLARQMIEQMPATTERDAAYSQIIARHAQDNPYEAAGWIDNINDETQRSAAAGNVAQHWYNNDPAGATRWVESMPAGQMRDMAIVRMSSHFVEMTPAQQSLIDSIQDESTRTQAQLNGIRMLMQRDPAEARRRLSELDLPPYQRQQYETMLNRMAGG